MRDFTRAGLWKMTTIGVVVVAATAVVTGLVVANRTAPKQEASVEAPSASPPVAQGQVHRHRQGRRHRRFGRGGGTIYGIWDNKKNDEHYRAAYGSCMKARGYTG